MNNIKIDIWKNNAEKKIRIELKTDNVVVHGNITKKSLKHLKNQIEWCLQ